MLSGSLIGSLLQYETQAGIDLVVLASHEQRGLAHLSLGSMMKRLLQRGPAPIFVVPSSTHHVSLQHAIVPLDGSPGTEWALTLLSQLPRTVVGKVTLLRVVSAPSEVFEAYRYLSGVAERPELAHLSSRLRVAFGDPAERIDELAGEGIVVLTKPRHWTPHQLGSGSIAEHLIRNGSAALLIARQDTHCAGYPCRPSGR